MQLFASGRDQLLRFWHHGRHQLPMADALRGGVICVAPAVLAVTLHMPLLCWSAIAAFWTCLADEPGRPGFERHCKGLVFGVAGALASACAIAAHSLPVLSIAVVGAVAYAGASVRARGPASGLRGLLTATACSVSACFPAHGIDAATRYAGFYLVGSVWATLAGGSLWQAGRTKRAQQATLAYLHAMSLLVNRLGYAAQGNRARLEQGRAELRTKLDAMTAAIANCCGEAPSACTRWVDDAEQAIALLAGLETLLAGGHDAARREAASLLAPGYVQLALQIDASAAHLRDGPGALPSVVEQRLARVQQTLRACEPAWLSTHGPGEGLTWLRANLDLLERLAVLLARDVRMHAARVVAAGARGAPPERPRPGRLTARIAELAARNAYARYAARLSVAAMLAVTFARLSGLQQGYWLALTTMFILQPTLSQTVKVSGLRIGGTLLGAVLATALSFPVHDPLLLALVVLPLATGTLAARAVSYFSYILFLTSHFILVAHLGTPAGAPWALAIARAELSVAGVLVGFVVSLFAWPDRERHRLGSSAARALEGTAAYLDAVARRLAQPVPRGGETLGKLRRRACLDIDTLEATIGATRFESLVVDQQVACASVLMQRLRTLVGALCPLEYVDAMLDDTERARLSGLAQRAHAWLTHDACSGDLLQHPREDSGPEASSCHAREIEREVSESACVAHLLRSRVLR
ncbi:FUSC family protein [Paraburkholderia sp. BR14263]|uniref:FUSC family protein n=1 Tax=unclassified Paraburkholderia TaxID=2615204 RepID=UPI0034CD6B26